MRSQTAIQERSYGGRQLEDERTRQRVKVEQLLHESECGGSISQGLRAREGEPPAPPPLPPDYARDYLTHGGGPPVDFDIGSLVDSGSCSGGLSRRPRALSLLEG